MSRFYEMRKSDQKTFLTKSVQNDEKLKPYFMTSCLKMLNNLITRQFALKLEHTSYIVKSRYNVKLRHVYLVNFEFGNQTF